MSVTSPPPLADRLEHLAMEFAEKGNEHPASPLSEYVKAHAYSLNEFAGQARRTELRDGVGLTAAQQHRVALLVAHGTVRSLTFGYEPFDLPDGYVTVSIAYCTGESIFGGISPEGELST